MIVVTGGAGFIGSCLVARLNEAGYRDIIVVDHWDQEGLKKQNLESKTYVRFYDKQEFLLLVRADAIKDDISAVFHMGACSSTTGNDREYYHRNNYEYSVDLARWALARKARFIYASSAATYGDGECGYSDDPDEIRKLKPLNFYGESKQQFDLWILNQGLINRVAGLKFFNVFGPNEYHKGDMKSVIAKAWDRVLNEGRMDLFRSYREGYADGEQKRDFIYVKDVVAVMMFLLEHGNVNGIFNLGTGTSRTWNDLARAIFVAAGRPVNIGYIDMPEQLRPRYQYFTEARMERLRAAGYTAPFMGLEQAVRDYAVYLKGRSHW